MNGFGLHVILVVGLILLSWLVWKGERPRLRQDGPRDAHSPRLSFLVAKALKRFEECVALLQVGINNDTDNQLARQS